MKNLSLRDPYLFNQYSDKYGDPSEGESDQLEHTTILSAVRDVDAHEFPAGQSSDLLGLSQGPLGGQKRYVLGDWGPEAGRHSTAGPMLQDMSSQLTPSRSGSRASVLSHRYNDAICAWEGSVRRMSGWTVNRGPTAASSPFRTSAITTLKQRTTSFFYKPSLHKPSV
ncbi:hypothetical protein K491DRAFT_310699 [Lophiostoma macrostomum CBS 122681]|uniref:Uncharacterized protein n=1 Tax=Lophiostoma macrostomum CBS 122681 TaxID=1314788 RepID=A0A6A6SK81_9PLEO|nr:hypothetical protein K491DRAFT_310699 [Lophiostoma macrostomum CBS 122681]